MLKHLLLLIFLVVSSMIWSTVIVVDNNIPSIGQFADLQAAHDAASAGDTLYVIPSNRAYTIGQITQQIHLVGTGWQPQSYDGDMIKTTELSGYMYFNPGSDHSSIDGFGGEFIIFLYSHWVTIKNCKVDVIGLGNQYYSPQNALIMNNWIHSSGSSYPLQIYYGQSVTFQLINNVITSPGSAMILTHTPNSLLGSCRIVNNTIRTATPGNLCTSASYTDVTMINNIVSSILPSSPSIHHNISGSAAYECISNDLHTLPGSVAIDAGVENDAYDDLDGTRNDCGAYGGPTPFVNGGIPGYPAIYEINGPGVATPNETIPIQIKAKTNRD